MKSAERKRAKGRVEMMSEQEETKCWVHCGWTHGSAELYCSQCGTKRPKPKVEVSEEDKRRIEALAKAWCPGWNMGEAPFDQWEQLHRHAGIALLAKAREICGQEAAGLQSEIAALKRKLADALQLAEERLAHSNALQENLEAEKNGMLALRAKYGARENETFGQFVARLAEKEQAEPSGLPSAKCERCYGTRWVAVGPTGDGQCGPSVPCPGCTTNPGDTPPVAATAGELPKMPRLEVVTRWEFRQDGMRCNSQRGKWFRTDEAIVAAQLDAQDAVEEATREARAKHKRLWRAVVDYLIARANGARDQERAAFEAVEQAAKKEP